MYYIRVCLCLFSILILVAAYRGLHDGGDYGTVVYSVVPPGKISEVLGPGWVLMDGRPLKDSDKLRQLTQMERIPDARGIFLRGMNEGRSDGFEDPSGNRDILEPKPQAHLFSSHKHSIIDNGHDHVLMVRNVGAGTLPEVGILYGGPTHSLGADKLVRKANSNVTVDSFGGAETRPTNIAVYTYVKIN